MKPGLLTGAALIALYSFAVPAAMADRANKEDYQGPVGKKTKQETRSVPVQPRPAAPRPAKPQPRNWSTPTPLPKSYTPVTPKRDYRINTPRNGDTRVGLPVVPGNHAPVKQSNGQDLRVQRPDQRGVDNNRNRNPYPTRNPNPGGNGSWNQRSVDPNPDYRVPPNPGVRNNNWYGGPGSMNGGQTTRNGDNNNRNSQNRNDRNRNDYRYRDGNPHEGRDRNRNDNHYRDDHRYNDHDRNRNDNRRYDRYWPRYTTWVDPWYLYPGPYYDYYGSGVRFSFFGGYGYQPGWSAYPWWYGDDYWGYRTRSGYRPGYGHVGHSNVYCTDPSHATYQYNWRYDDNYFSMYSDWTDGAHGGYNIRDCHMENARGNFDHRPAMVRETVCWDENSQAYVPTGAVQLISYF